jgi:DnaJ-class molecular chaperone
MDPKDYYHILGIETDAGPDRIKAAFRELAFQYHPDRNEKNPDASEKMKKINEAYAVLSNPAKRREYDSLRQQYGSTAYHRFREGYSEQDIFNGSDIHQVFEEMAKAFGFRGYHDIFREFYGNGYQTFQIKRPGIFMGGFIFSGSLGGRKKGQEQLSAGSNPLGRLVQGIFQKAIGIKPVEKGKDTHDVIALDEAAARQGGPYAYFHKKRSKKLMVKLPRNVRTGQKIRLAGMGDPGKGGGEPGDLYLQIHIKRPLLERIRKYISKKSG